ncbi:MAG: hypothetical protein ACYS7Y_15950 [Planctomycetota bacterium]|jgi:hypothetical protein
MGDEKRFNGYLVRQPHVGDVVIFTDSVARDHNALVVAVFGEADIAESSFYKDGKQLFMPCLNAVWVSGDESKQDPYGRQIERDHTSIVHASSQAAHGIYWRWPGDPKNQIVEPTEK